MFADIFEMYLAAETAGVNAAEMVEMIHDRSTHNNILKRGPGIGGYCLTKDGLLRQWALAEFFAMNKQKFIRLRLKTSDFSPRMNGEDNPAKPKAEALRRSGVMASADSAEETKGTAGFSPRGSIKER